MPEELTAFIPQPSYDGEQMLQIKPMKITDVTSIKKWFENHENQSCHAMSWEQKPMISLVGVQSSTAIILAHHKFGSVTRDFRGPDLEGNATWYDVERLGSLILDGVRGVAELDKAIRL